MKSRDRFLCAGVSFLAASSCLSAYDFTWNPSSTDYTNSNNWNPTSGAPPNSQSVTVGFPSGGTNFFPMLSGTGNDYSFGSFDFESQTYTFTLSTRATLSGYGDELPSAGFLNAGSATIQIQTGTLTFNGSSTGGAAHYILSGGGSSSLGGYVDFTTNSTAGSGTYTLQNASAMTFLDNASARTATFSLQDQSNIVFRNETSAGSCAYALSGSAFIVLHDSSTLGSAVCSGTGSTNIKLFDSSTLGSAQISLNAGTLYLGSSSPDSTASIALSNNAIFYLDSGSTDSNTLSSLSTDSTSQIFLNPTSNTTSQLLTVGSGTIQGQIISGTPSGQFVFGTIAKTGSGTLTLTNVLNNFRGTIEVQDGVLNITSEDVLGIDTNNLVLAGGTLQFGGAFSLELINVNTTGSASTIDSQGNAVGIASTISGTGGIIKIGSGTLTLSGTNSYSGQTTITSGTILLGSNGAIPSGNSIAMNGGIFNLNGYTATVGALTYSSGTLNLGGGTLTVTGSCTYSGSITGAGNLTNQNSGVFILSGTNSYTGLTTVTSGTLQLGSSAAFPSGNNLTVNGGIFDLNDYSTTIGQLNGSGGVVSLGSLSTTTLTLSGNGSYGGSITGAGKVIIGGSSVALTGGGSDGGAGSLEILSGATFDISGVSSSSIVNNLSGAGNIALGSKALTVNQTAAGTFSGAIGGSGSLTKSGGAAFTLSGTNSYSGSTTVDVGSLVIGTTGALTQTSQVTVNSGATLAVNGLITAPITVNSGGTLQGGSPTQATNLVQGSVTVYGTMAPGNSIGTFMIDGDYDQGPNSSFTCEFDTTQADQLIVTGDITIDPTATFHYVPAAAIYQPDTTYQFPVIQSTNGVISNSFSLITDDSASINVRLFPTQNGQGQIQEIWLIVDFTALGDGCLFGNPQSVAAALDAIYDGGNDELDSLVYNLYLLNQEELSYALNQLHPAQYKALTVVQQNSAVRVNQAAQNRLQSVLDQAYCVRNSFDPERKPRLIQFWTDLIGDLLHQNPANYAESDQVSYQATTGGVVAGADLNFGKYYYLGAFGAATRSHVTWGSGHGKGRLHSGYAGLYAAALGKTFYGNLSIMGAWDGSHQHRAIVFPGYNDTAHAKQHGTQFLSHLDFGANLAVVGYGVTLRPFDAIDYIVQTESGFTETGAQSLDITAGKNVDRLLRNELGLNLDKCFQFKNITWTLDAKLSWIREMRLSGRGYHCQFVDTDVEFTVIGNMPNRDLISPGLRLTTLMRDGDVNLTLYYDGAFTRDYRDQSLGFQCGVRF